MNEHGGDAPEFPGLLHTTIDAGFAPSAVVADKGYLSHRNYAVAEKLGLRAHIPFKVNSNPMPRGVRVWRDMYHLFALDDGQFDDLYNQRSQVESTNSALKRKMGEPLLSKGSLRGETKSSARSLAKTSRSLPRRFSGRGLTQLNSSARAIRPLTKPNSLNPWRKA